MVTREIANQIACEDVTLAKGGMISWGECPKARWNLVQQGNL